MVNRLKRLDIGGENSVVKCRKTGKMYSEITSSIQLLVQFG